MPVARLGTYILHQAASDGTIAITVPSDAEMCVVIATGYNAIAGAYPLFDKLSWANTSTVDFPLVVDSTGWGNTQVEVRAMLVTDAKWPGSGTKTLYYSSYGTYGEGYNIAVLFYKGIDVGNPVIGTAERTEGISWTGTVAGVGANDMIVGAAYRWNGAPNMDATGYGQTSILESSYAYAGIGIGEKLGSTSYYIESADDQLVPTVCALRAAAGGSTSVTVSDTAHGSDAITGLLVRLSIVDSAAGVDGFGNRAAAVPVADSAIGSDIIANIRAAFIVADVSTAVDAITLTVHVPVADAGTAADVLSILTALLKVVADSGTGTDAVQVGVAPLLVADAATGLDLLQISAAVSIADLGTGIDALAILQALLKVVTDAATGTDGIGGISVAVPVSDAGHGLDLIGALTVAARVVDLAQGFDAVVRITGEGSGKRIVITFSAKKPSIAFGPGKTPGITIH